MKGLVVISSSPEGPLGGTMPPSVGLLGVTDSPSRSEAVTSSLRSGVLDSSLIKEPTSPFTRFGFLRCSLYWARVAPTISLVLTNLVSVEIWSSVALSRCPPLWTTGLTRPKSTSPTPNSLNRFLSPPIISVAKSPAQAVACLSLSKNASLAPGLPGVPMLFGRIYASNL